MATQPDSFRERLELEWMPAVKSAAVLLTYLGSEHLVSGRSIDQPRSALLLLGRVSASVAIVHGVVVLAAWSTTYRVQVERLPDGDQAYGQPIEDSRYHVDLHHGSVWLHFTIHCRCKGLARWGSRGFVETQPELHIDFKPPGGVRCAIEKKSANVLTSGPGRRGARVKLDAPQTGQVGQFQVELSPVGDERSLSLYVSARIQRSNPRIRKFRYRTVRVKRLPVRELILRRQ